MPGSFILHYLLEFAQIHVHWIGYAIQPSHPLSSPSPSALKSFPASGSFPMRQLFTSGGQSIGVSVSASVLPVNIQGWFALGLSVQYSSIQFSRSVVSDSLWPHGLQHARPPCPSPTPGVYPNSCPLSWWCHPTFSSSVVPFSSCLQSFPASGSFQMSWFFASGGQSIEVSVSASVLPVNTQDWFPLGWTGWISWQSPPTPQLKSINFSVLSFLYSPILTSIHDYWKNQSFE